MRRHPLIRALASKPAVHAYLWLALFFFVALTANSKETSTSLAFRLKEGLRLVGFALIPVYLHFWIFERFFGRRRFLAYTALSLALLVGYVFIFQAAASLLTIRRNQPLADIVILFFLLLVSITAKILNDSARQKALLLEIRTKQAQAELALLKAQIHPHFLFNTLNNLFGMARRDDPATADGIARLAHLIRYMIEDGGADRVNLDKEVEQIRRLIELEKLRIAAEDDVEIGFTIEGETASVRIPPLLLFPFVENAFKHGISASSKSFIRIRLSACRGGVRFSVRNSIPPGAAQGHGSGDGLGLRNVRRRLELLYPGAHLLTVGEEDGEFRVELALGALPEADR
jgi:two-component system LytT family sensor kinase